MRRASARLWGLLAGLLFALALAACLLLWNAPGGEWVAVERDGEELFRFRPADIEGAQTFDIPCDGGYNTIAVENGEVRVVAADCPDQTCVKMGALRSRALPIVCLPHHLTIRFVDGAEDGGLDAVAR